MLRRVDCRTATDVSKNRSAFIFWVTEPKTAEQVVQADQWDKKMPTEVINPYLANVEDRVSS